MTCRYEKTTRTLVHLLAHRSHCVSKTKLKCLSTIYWSSVLLARDIFRQRVSSSSQHGRSHKEPRLARRYWIKTRFKAIRTAEFDSREDIILCVTGLCPVCLEFRHFEYEKLAFYDIKEVDRGGSAGWESYKGMASFLFIVLCNARYENTTESRVSSISEPIELTTKINCPGQGQ